MPRYSDRKKALQFVKNTVELAMAMVLDSSSSEDEGGVLDFELPGFEIFDKSHFTSDSSEDISQLDTLESFDSEDPFNHYSDSDDRPEDLLELYFVMYNTRFFAPRHISSKSTEFRQEFFHTLSDGLFRQVTRMNKSSFFHLLGLVEACPIFANNAPIQQAPIEAQLAVCLDRLGHNGNGACLNHMVPTWGVSVGSLVNFSKRCFHALELVLKDEIMWPTKTEARRSGEAFGAKGFPGCVGLIDGTLMPLAQRPHRSGESYWTRKSRYAINVQVVCDDRRRILHMFAGMPGSCSDLTCTKKSPIWNYVADIRSNDMFELDHYLLGDSGYQGMPHMVCAFKNSDTSANKEDFNTCVAKCRVTNEHCIGVLKSRWHSLKEIRVQLNQRKDSIWMVRWVVLCGSLHNYVISQHNDWTDEDEVADVLTQAPSVSVPDVEPGGASGSDPGSLNANTRLLAVGNRLLLNVMEHALAHARQPGGFLSTEPEDTSDEVV